MLSRISMYLVFTVCNVLLDLIDRDFSEFYFQMHSIHVNILC